VDFVAWCEFYYNVQQMEDPPSNDILEDDEALDHFLRMRKSKNEQEARKARLEAAKSGGGNKKAGREKLL
jgi:hypothetical protein